MEKIMTTENGQSDMRTVPKIGDRYIGVLQSPHGAFAGNCGQVFSNGTPITNSQQLGGKVVPLEWIKKTPSLRNYQC